MLNKIIKYCIYLIVLLVPMFFLPFTLEAFDFNKVYLLTILTTLGVLCWLGRMVFQEKQIKIKFNLFDATVLLFLIVTLLSAVFSVDKQASWFGFYGRFWPSTISVLTLTLFYFLVSNNVALDKKEGKDKSTATLSGTLKMFLVSCLVIVMMAYLSVFDILSKIATRLNGVLPEVMTLRTFSPIGGSLESLSLFLVCVSVLLIALLALRDRKGLLTEQAKTKKVSTLLYILLFSGLGLIAIINFNIAWLTLIISLVLFLAFAFWKRLFKENVNRLSLSIFFVLIALAFLLFNPLSQILPADLSINNLPNEVILNQRASWKLALDGVKENPVLGSGVSTFSYIYSQYKPAAILESDFWQLRFDRSGSHLAELVATTGILGILSYLILILIFGLITYLIISTVKTKGLSKKLAGEVDETGAEREERKVLILPFFITFIALLVSQFFYYQNATLGLFFFLVLALGSVVFSGRKTKVFKFGDFPEMGLVFSILFWVLLTTIVFGYFTLGKNYTADVYYRQYLKDPSTNLSKLEQAARLNGKEMIYHLALANDYLANFRAEAVEAAPDTQKITNLVALSVKEVKSAIEVSPKMVATYEMAGIVYSTIRPAADGAIDWAKKSFESALELEPTNPATLTQLALLYLAEDNQEKGRELLERAVANKSNYVPAQIQLARLESEAGNSEATQERLENLVAKAPFSVEARFELGRLYFNEARYQDAREQFEAAVILFPNHSNSLYSLGLTYEKLDMVEEALLAFNKVLSLNPGNKEIIAQIERLESGGAAPAETEENFSPEDINLENQENE
ncbi:tetratricopeptide repeat protein [Candidatus Parcubacteria bacterium]|nr:tetratricopeptide repeat protein [Candidatus Parcubacteria bacterium]